MYIQIVRSIAVLSASLRIVSLLACAVVAHDNVHRSLPIEFEQKAVRGEIEGVEPGQSNFFTMW